MKKITLLLIACIIAVSAGAQERMPSVVFNNNLQGRSTPRNIGRPVSKGSLKDINLNRTTSTGSYWYDFPDSVLGTVDSIDLSTMPIWQDTAAIFGTGNATTPYIGYSVPSYGYSYNTSIGSIFDPMDSAWAAYGSFIPPSSGFTIDSVMVVGIYGRPAGATYTDSLKLTFVYGNGNTSSNLPFNYFNETTLLGWYGLSGDTALFFPDMFWDTAQNTATNNPLSSIAAVTYTFPLGQTDTSVAHLFARSYAVNFVVPPGNFASMSLSFISGAATFPTFPVTDTVQYTDGTFKYGSFQPLIAYSPGTVWAYPPVSTLSLTNDFTTGFFKTEGSTDGNGWSPFYLPTWAYYASPSGGSYQQFPYILFHASHDLTTTTTTTVNKRTAKVTAYPNPATDEVTIAYTLPTPAPVSLSLTNMLGQVVSVQNMGEVASGKVAMNTSALPAGMYFYTVTANGQPNTGRVVVVH